VFKPLPIAKMIPAAGQGAIALECRAGEAEQFHAVRCESTTRAVLIERAALAALGGGCQMSSAAHFKNGQLHIYHEPKGRAVFSVVEKSTERAIAAAITAISAWLKAKQ